MRILGYVLATLLLAACSSDNRTQYGSFKEENRGGYTHQKIAKDLQTVNFRANTYTKKNIAELFARFRSIELCRDNGKKFSHILGVLDRSDSKDIVRSTSNVYGFPSYYYGYSPFYSRYSGIGFTAGLNTVTSQTWNQTLIYPHYEVLFHCTDEVVEPEVIFRQVSAEEMKHLVKDLKGALQVETIMEGSPNKQLESGDIILRAAGERVTKNWQIFEKFGPDKASIPIEILREGKRMKITLKAAPVTKQVAASQLEIIKAACAFEEVNERYLCK